MAPFCSPPPAVLPRPVTARCCCTAVKQSAARGSQPHRLQPLLRATLTDAASCSPLPSSDVQLPGFLCSPSCSLKSPVSVRQLRGGPFVRPRPLSSHYSIYCPHLHRSGLVKASTAFSHAGDSLTPQESMDPRVGRL